ncbi:MAG: hypothetical protein H7Y31_16600 [Chitinophagaceae bacterium]|nr:hypothetical protein [Chitinophagaceae bacterium]
MKKIAAILLTALLFFNWYGYRLVSDILQDRSDSKLEARLDKNEYDESQLVELRVPMNLPYHNDWSEFERFNGVIEIDGVHYNYVKRKVDKGELVLLCLPNNEKQLLQSARDNFFKLVNDLQQPSSGNKSEKGNTAAFKSLFAEYQQEKNNWTVAEVLFSTELFSISKPKCSLSGFATSPEQPPELS